MTSAASPRRDARLGAWLGLAGMLGAAPAGGVTTAPTTSDPAAPAVPTPEPVTPTLVVESADWTQAFADGRDLLLGGKFDAAAARFSALSRDARTLLGRHTAYELSRLAADFRKAGVSVVKSGELEDSALVARRENRRSADEISFLYVNGVLYGLGTAGLVAVHTEPDTAAGVVLPGLVLGAAGAGAVALVDYSGKGLGYGVPQAIVSGLYIGLGEGVTWAIWNQARVGYEDEWSDKTVANIVWGSATLGAVGGGVLASVYGGTPGRASYVGSAALWTSAVAGLGTGAAISEPYRQDDGALLAAAIGLNAGVVAGVLTAGEVSPSIARVRFLDLGAAAGGLALGGLYVSAAGRDPDPRGVMGMGALGIASGLGAAWFLTDGMRKDSRDDDTPPAPPRTGLLSGGFTLGQVPGGATLVAYGWL